MQRSSIAGMLGDGKNAVALMRQAFSDGVWYARPWDWFLIVCERIRDYEPWQELMRPKGQERITAGSSVEEDPSPQGMLHLMGVIVPKLSHMPSTKIPEKQK